MCIANLSVQLCNSKVVIFRNSCVKIMKILYCKFKTLNNTVKTMSRKMFLKKSIFIIA